jgi:hypothetical protein
VLLFFFYKDNSFVNIGEIIPTCLVEVLVAVALLANVEWDVTVLDHVADLAFHGQREQDAKVHQQDGPEHRNVEYPE